MNLILDNIIKTKSYDFIVVGAGLSGLTVANRLAKHNKKVLIIEKRNHIGGNSYDCYDESGILIHKYGPHIFHTNYEEVFSYLKTFVEFYKYEHRVLGNIDGKLVPVPFNFKSLDILLPNQSENIKKTLLEKYPNKDKVSVFDLLNDKDVIIHKFGEFVYDKVFAQYTAKQWGIAVENVDKSVINRVPVNLSYEDRYFADKYQYMPKNGFTALFDKMVENNNIDVLLNVDANRLLKLTDGVIYFADKKYQGKVIYTGEIDSLFNCQFGRLPYRSLRLDFMSFDQTHFQEAAVINYNTSEDFTRISEFKYLTNQIKDNKTTILKEYSQKYDGNNIPYYPIINEENLSLYNKYKSLADQYKNLYLCGRLAQYKYFNMDATIKSALELVDNLLD